METNKMSKKEVGASQVITDNSKVKAKLLARVEELERKAKKALYWELEAKSLAKTVMKAYTQGYSTGHNHTVDGHYVDPLDEGMFNDLYYEDFLKGLDDEL